MAHELTPASGSTPATPAASTNKTSDQIAGEYADNMSNNDFVVEWAEGKTSATHLTPSQMRELVDLQREKEAIAQRAAGNTIFKRIVD